METEPLLYKPKVFYSLAGAGIVSGGLGLTSWAHYPNAGWWVGFLLASACFVGVVVAWAIKVPRNVKGAP